MNFSRHNYPIRSVNISVVVCVTCSVYYVILSSSFSFFLFLSGILNHDPYLSVFLTIEGRNKREREKVFLSWNKQHIQNLLLNEPLFFSDSDFFLSPSLILKK